MSAFDRKPITNLMSNSVSKIALNPVVTATLLWALTKGPPSIRERLLNVVSPLRDPRTLAHVVKALRWLLAIGVVGTANRTLNDLALNAWRVKSEKARWNWNNEVAVVTGGCSGIGELVVKKLINNGIKVAVLDIQQSLPPDANVKLYSCDVTDPGAVSSVAQQIGSSLGPPSILINNAGIAQAHTIMNTSPEYLRKIFEVNLFSNWYTIKAFLPDMIKKEKGHIVTVASTASFIGVAGMTDYCATKAAVLAFHEGLNLELKNKYNAPKVITTSIHPSFVQTPLIEPFEKQLRAAKVPILEISTVASATVDQILKCSGGQVFLPASMSTASSLRGLPNWLQEMIRAGPSKTILQGMD